jgi:histone arginine demethylase JMJD6
MLLHVDPLSSSAWNSLIVGTKQWFVVEPLHHTIYDKSESSFNFDSKSYDSYGQSMLSDDHRESELNLQYWFKNTVPEITHQIHTIQPTRKIFSFTQYPGDTVFIPAEWHHAVLNLETTVAITHNFVQSKHIDRYLELLKNDKESDLSAEEIEECRVAMLKGVRR